MWVYPFFKDLYLKKLWKKIKLTTCLKTRNIIKYFRILEPNSTLFPICWYIKNKWPHIIQYHAACAVLDTMFELLYHLNVMPFESHSHLEQKLWNIKVLSKILDGCEISRKSCRWGKLHLQAKHIWCPECGNSLCNVIEGQLIC